MTFERYNPQSILSHNCLYNFVHGARGLGKTYGFTKVAIDRFVANKGSFIYLRRRDVDIEYADLKKFFTAVQHEYPNYEVRVQGKEFFLGEDVIGLAHSLSTQGSKKGTANFSEITLIIFDEYSIDGFSNSKYLKQEVDLFFNLMETIGRDREVIVVFLGNNTSSVNPYLIDPRFNLRIPTQGEFYKNPVHKEAVLQVCKNAAYADYRKNTRAGKVAGQGEFGSYMYDNTILLDNKEFIETKTNTAKCWVNFDYMGRTFGVWYSAKTSLFYVSFNFDPFCKFHYSLTLDDFREDRRYIKQLKANPIFSKFLAGYANGQVRFENQIIKQIVFNVFVKGL